MPIIPHVITSIGAYESRIPCFGGSLIAVNSSAQRNEMRNDKIKIIKKGIDCAAAAAIAYPFLFMLVARYQNDGSPAVLDNALELKIGAMALCVPGTIWMWWRQVSDPPGSHPILDRFARSGRFRLGFIFVSLLVFFVLQCLIGAFN